MVDLGIWSSFKRSRSWKYVPTTFTKKEVRIGDKLKHGVLWLEHKQKLPLSTKAYWSKYVWMVVNECNQVTVLKCRTPTRASQQAKALLPQAEREQVAQMAAHSLPWQLRRHWSPSSPTWPHTTRSTKSITTTLSYPNNAPVYIHIDVIVRFSKTGDRVHQENHFKVQREANI